MSKGLLVILGQKVFLPHDLVPPPPDTNALEGFCSQGTKAQSGLLNPGSSLKPSGGGLEGPNVSDVFQLQLDGGTL